MNFTNHIINLIIAISSSSVLTFVLAFFSFKYDLIKIKASSSSEVSKSDQEKITTAEKTIELVDKLRERMDNEFIRMSLEIDTLKAQVQGYKIICDTCTFRVANQSKNKKQ